MLYYLVGRRKTVTSNTYGSHETWTSVEIFARGGGNLKKLIRRKMTPYMVKKTLIRVGVKYSTCTWYLYLSTYLSVLDVLEYLVYGNVKVLVLVLVLDQKVLGTWKVIFKYYLLKSVKIANYHRIHYYNCLHTWYQLQIAL